jgi:DNA-directed RNA polymerase specialized sigma24 family protein
MGENEHPQTDDDLLARITEEALDRMREGGAVDPGAYAAGDPDLGMELHDQIETMEVLERLGAWKREARAAPEEDLGRALEALSPLVQRLIYLRSIRKLLWAEIAKDLRLPEVDLRRAHAEAISRLIGAVEDGRPAPSRE